MSLIDLKSLNAMFRPQSVAVIGASSDPMKIGGKPIDLMKIWGYSGRIIPVNPKSDVIQDLPAFPSISDVDGDVDLAICAVPGKLAVQAVAQSVAKGVKGMIMFSSGFAETSEDGAATQQEMAAMARAGGMRLMGPNCMGAANLHMGLLATFHRAFETPFKPSNISVVSQSGAFGGFCAFLAAQRGLGLSHMFTTGNEADLEASECLAYLAMDPETDVILLYMEGCRNGPKFIEAMQMARDNKKPVIAIKLGSTDAGAQAAASHTAALAGSDKVFDAILRQYGAYRAHSIEEFLDVAAAAAVGGLPSNDKVGLVTVSGGVGVLMADDAERRGLDVARLPESTQKKFKELVPFAGVNNPLDVTGQVANDPSLYRKAMDLVLTEADYGAIVGFQGVAFSSSTAMTMAVPQWVDLKRDYPDQWFAVSGMFSTEARETLTKAGLLTFPEPTHATRAIAALSNFAKTFARPLETVTIGTATDLPIGAIGEHQALSILGAAGLPVMPSQVATSVDDAVAAANELGLPVVMKIASPDITHKSDVGGVRLNLTSADAVRAAYEEIMANVAANAPKAAIEGCLLAPMIDGGVETIIGVSSDPVFGPIIMFGLGGVLVEVLEDVSFRAAPFGVAEAHRMIDEIKGRKVLDGVRGAPAADVGALAAALSQLSLFAAANADRIESIDANPFLVREKGCGAMALDAVIITK